MILDIDWGNSRLKWRLRRGSTVLARGSVADLHELGTALSAKQNADQEFGVNPDERSWQNVLISSVRSSKDNDELRAWLAQRGSGNIWFAHSERYGAGVTNAYREPSTLGVDRWLALLATRSIYERPAVIVQLGTALVVDVLGDDGRHQGGFIGPGWQLMQQALNLGTAAVRVQGRWQSRASAVLGNSTQGAVEGGLLAMVFGMVERARSLAGADAEVILAGGDAALLLSEFPEAKEWPDIVMDGLVVAHRCAD